MSGGFRRVSELEVWKGRRTGISILTIEGPDGKTFERELVHHQDAVAIVPVLPGGEEVVLVRQYRPAIDAWVLEIPAGLCDVVGEALEATARRELAEEVGYRADRLELLTSFHNAVGSTPLRTTVFLGLDLEECAKDLQGIEEEHMTIETLALDDAERRIEAGDITDAKTVVGLLMAARRLS